MIQFDLFDAPAPEPEVRPRDRARYYQAEAVRAILDEFERVRSTLLVMATGLGKTKCIGEVVRDWEGRVLVCAHRSELVDQLRERLEHDTGEQVGLEQAEFKSSGERVVVGMIQSLHQKGRLQRIAEHGDFTLVVHDEAHHGPAKSYTKVLQTVQASGSKLLGVTATPDRGDGKAMGALYESVAYEMDIVDGIEHGWLVPLKGDSVKVKSVDLRRVRSVAGDLNQGQLEEIIIEAVEPVVKVVVEKYPERKGILFFPGKGSATLAAERLKELGKTAAVITDDTPKLDRRRIVRDLKAGKIQYLANCMVATEGFDWPACDLVVIARLTKSRSLYAQMCGRGTRTLARLVEHVEGPEGAGERRALIRSSHKQDCVILDVVGNAGKHQLITPVDILGGRFTEAERKLAKKKEKESGGDPEDHLKAARSELLAMAKAFDSVVKYDSKAFDPFRIYGMDPEKHDELRRMRQGNEPPSVRQIATLERYGLKPDQIRMMSKAAARKFIGTEKVRRSKGLCSFKILRKLQEFGVTRKNVSMRAGIAAMQYLEARGWGKYHVDEQELNRIIDNT